ncbi:hypothetical protein J4403_04400 [Candidatus Woesearchaeota archaeon]|nr:hypothetical protein [Candidatus Woesearchaeota archaeon]
MLEKFKEDVKKIESSKEFKDLKKTCKNLILADGFILLEKQNYDSGDYGDWQIDFFDKDSGCMFSFTFEDKKINVKKTTEIVKADEEVHKVNIKNLKISFEAILEKVERIREKNYSNERPYKIIIIIQNRKKQDIWNITYLTANFKTLNLKISAETGDLIEESLKPLISFG